MSRLRWTAVVTLALALVLPAVAGPVAAADPGGTHASADGPAEVPGEALADPPADNPAGAPADAFAASLAIADANASPADEPRIAGVHPNPVADEDRGEFVVLALPADADPSRYRLTDGDGNLTVTARPSANAAASGRVALTTDPTAVRNLTDVAVLNATGDVALANGGERLRLLRGNETVARARYREAPEGKVGRYDDRGAIAWEPLGTTDRPVVTARGGAVRAFVLPDAPDVAVETIRDADRRVLLAGYTFTSRRVARALERAADRGVSVHVLLEGKPVDGISRRQARVLDSLVRANVTVELLGGPHGRYAYHHAQNRYLPVHFSTYTL